MSINPNTTVVLKAGPSFAPVVIVTSVSGSNWRPKDGEYASARAFFKRGRPCIDHQNPIDSVLVTTDFTFVGEYWLQSTRSSATLAALMANDGGL
jgi:hypothetical protein